MTAELFVKLQEAARIEGARWIVKLSFKVSRDLWRAHRKDEIQPAVFSDPLSRAEKEDLVLHDWTTECETVIPTLQKRGFVLRCIERVRRIKRVVAEEDRSKPVIGVAAAACDDVDHCARRLSKLCAKTRGQHLEFRDRLLVEL